MPPKALRLTSTALYLLLSLFLVAFGVLYFSVTNLLWFHAAAVPKEALSDVRPLYFALMKLIGGAHAALGLLGAYIVLLPLRRGVPFAATAVTIAYAIPIFMAALVAEHLRITTGAPTSWHIMGILMAVNLGGFGAHVLANRAAPALAAA